MDFIAKCGYHNVATALPADPLRAWDLENILWHKKDLKLLEADYIHRSLL